LLALALLRSEVLNSSCKRFYCSGVVTARGEVVAWQMPENFGKRDNQP